MLGIRQRSRTITSELPHAEALPQTTASGADVPSRRPLFRQEVLEFQQLNRQWGRVVPLQPVSTRFMVWCVVFVVAGVIAFLFFGQYARKQSAPGYLAPASGTARVFASQAGTISAVYVHQGQHVQQGQPLLAILTSQTDLSGNDVNATILNTLSLQKQALTREIANEVHRTDFEQQRLTAQVQEHENFLKQLDAQMLVQRARVSLLEKVLESGAQLRVKGLVSEVEQRHREDAMLEQRQGMISLDQQITTRRGQLSEVRSNLDQLPLTQSAKIQALRNELSATEQRIEEVNGHSAYVIRAPIGGEISLLQSSVGQPADPRRLQLQIVPSNSPLQAELFIPVSAIGFVSAGQDVRILYDAFPYQRFGTYHGKIVSLSQTVLLASDAETPVTLKEPAYRATVALDQPNIVAHGKKIPLQPDMSLRADIILEKHTLAEWILAPLRHLGIDG